MTKDEINQKGLELVAYSGDARSCYLKALKLIKDNRYVEADELITEANELITEAHISQTELLHLEAQGEYSDLTFIMVHGQDHLMTTILLKDIMETLIFFSKKIQSLGG